MRHDRFWPRMTLVLAMAAASGGCLLIPQIKDRLVELAVSGTTSAVFTVSGSDTQADVTEVVDVGTELNLQQILSDAGIDASQVTNIGLSGMSYRITRADADPTREIFNGTITVQRGGGPVQNLVVGFSASPGSASGFQTVTLDAAGVAVLNALLDELLAEVQGGPPAVGLVTFRLTGEMTSSSGNAADFDVEVKITIGVTGQISVKVPT